MNADGPAIVQPLLPHVAGAPPGTAPDTIGVHLTVDTGPFVHTRPERTD